MMPRTIRARVTTLAVVLTAVLLVGVSVLVIAVLRFQLADNLDENVAQRADTIGAVISDQPGGPFGGDEDLLVQVVGADGTILASTSNLGETAPIAPLAPGYTTTSSVPGRTETFRVLTRPIESGGQPAYLLVGINSDDVADP